MCIGSRYVTSVEVGFPCLYLTYFSLVASDLFMCMLFLCSLLCLLPGQNLQTLFLGCHSQSNLDHWLLTVEVRKSQVGS